MNEITKKRLNAENDISLRIGPNQGILISGGFPIEGVAESTRGDYRGNEFTLGREYLRPAMSEKALEREVEFLKGGFHFERPALVSKFGKQSLEEFEQGLHEANVDLYNAAKNLEAASPRHMLYLNNRYVAGGRSEKELLDEMNLVCDRVANPHFREALTISLLGTHVAHASEIPWGGTHGDKVASKSQIIQLTPEPLQERVVNYAIRAGVRDMHTDSGSWGLTLRDNPGLVDLIHPANLEHAIPKLDALHKQYNGEMWK